jgi:predicted ATPase
MVTVGPVLAGRAAEIAVLGESSARARGGSPATVLIGGEAGIGKTRLVRHFTADIEAEVLYGGCVDLSGGGLPFAPFTAALRGHAESPAELLPGDVQLDSDTARAWLFEEVLTRFAGLCARRPVVFVIEDIHWIDRSSLDLLSFLVHDQQAAGTLLCLVTYRSDELQRAHPLRRSLAELDRIPWVRRMELSRLTRRAVGSLAGAIAGAEPTASLVAEIHRRSEGNPFFAEVLLDRQDQPGLPESLRDLLLAWVAQLPEPTQAVLRTASAGVGQVSHELLAAASGLDNGALSAALRPAVVAGVRSGTPSPIGITPPSAAMTGTPMPWPAGSSRRTARGPSPMPGSPATCCCTSSPASARLGSPASSATPSASPESAPSS